MFVNIYQGWNVANVRHCVDAVVPNLEVRPQDEFKQDDGIDEKNILLSQKVI